MAQDYAAQLEDTARFLRRCRDAGLPQAHFEAHARCVDDAAAEIRRLRETNSGLVRDHNALLADGAQWQRRAEQAEADVARLRTALRDLIDAIPDETLAADPPLKCWVDAGEAALSPRPRRGAVDDESVSFSFCEVSQVSAVAAPNDLTVPSADLPLAVVDLGAAREAAREGSTPAIDRCCGERAPGDSYGRTCDKRKGHDGDHWTYAGDTLTWPAAPAPPAGETPGLGVVKWPPCRCGHEIAVHQPSGDRDCTQCSCRKYSAPAQPAGGTVPARETPAALMFVREFVAWWKDAGSVYYGPKRSEEDKGLQHFVKEARKILSAPPAGERQRAGLPMPPPVTDAEVIAAVRGVLWEAMRGRDIGGDRTLVGMVKQLVAERDEARENRRGEFDLRMEAEARSRQSAPAGETAREAIPPQKVGLELESVEQQILRDIQDAAKKLRALAAQEQLAGLVEALEAEKRLGFSMKLGPLNGPLKDVQMVRLEPLETALRASDTGGTR